jgi:hypothetical protein
MCVDFDELEIARWLFERGMEPDAKAAVDRDGCRVAAEAHVWQLSESATTMSKQRKRSARRQRDELRPEYRVDYTSSRPNRFAAGMRGGAVAVVLEPDVARVFHTADSVNQLLRSVIAALPERNAKRRKAG